MFQPDQAHHEQESVLRKAYIILLLFGLISLFGDIIYEGGRSVYGPFLKELGGSALTIGFIVGLAELLGYATRLVSGFLTDKLRSPWLFMYLGYGLLISVPLMALAPSWEIAAVLLTLERIGKGIRSPAKDTLASSAAKRIGTGLGFGILEAIDQIGATAGPLIFSIIFLNTSRQPMILYQKGFAILGIFLGLLILILIACNIYYNRYHIQSFEKHTTEQTSSTSYLLWIYLLFTFVTTAGFINFALVGYYVKTHTQFETFHIPTIYALAMLVDAFSGIVCGKLYDVLKKKFQTAYHGILLAGIIPLFTFLCIPFLLSNSLIGIYSCAIIWGIVMGTHETIMKAIVADLTTWHKRATGYGAFHLTYGLALFIGSVAIGKMTDVSTSMVFIYVFLIQLIASAIYVYIIKYVRSLKKQ